MNISFPARKLIKPAEKIVKSMFGARHNKKHNVAPNYSYYQNMVDQGNALLPRSAACLQLVNGVLGDLAVVCSVAKLNELIGRRDSIITQVNLVLRDISAQLFEVEKMLALHDAFANIALSDPYARQILLEQKEFLVNLKTQHEHLITALSFSVDSIHKALTPIGGVFDFTKGDRHGFELIGSATIQETKDSSLRCMREAVQADQFSGFIRYIDLIPGEKHILQVTGQAEAGTAYLAHLKRVANRLLNALLVSCLQGLIRKENVFLSNR